MSNAKGDTLRMTTGLPDKNSKSGPRSWNKQEYEDFDFNYGAIDWSKKAKNPVEVDPNAHVCPLCLGEAPKGSCAACN